MLMPTGQEIDPAAAARKQKEPSALTRRHVAHTKRANHIVRDVKVFILRYISVEH